MNKLDKKAIDAAESKIKTAIGMWREAVEIGWDDGALVGWNLFSEATQEYSSMMWRLWRDVELSRLEQKEVLTH